LIQHYVALLGEL